MERGKSDCSADPREVSAIRDFIADVGGDVVLTQIPSVFSCPQRIQEIADAVGVPFFAPDPAGYSTTDGGVGHVDPALDQVDVELVRWAVEDGKPLLGICRGSQAINVACGGTLYQDIGSELPNALPACDRSRRTATG